MPTVSSILSSGQNRSQNRRQDAAGKSARTTADLIAQARKKTPGGRDGFALKNGGDSLEGTSKASSIVARDAQGKPEGDDKGLFGGVLNAAKLAAGGAGVVGKADKNAGDLDRQAFNASLGTEDDDAAKYRAAVLAARQRGVKSDAEFERAIDEEFAKLNPTAGVTGRQVRDKSTSGLYKLLDFVGDGADMVNRGIGDAIDFGIDHGVANIAGWATGDDKIEQGIRDATTGEDLAILPQMVGTTAVSMIPGVGPVLGGIAGAVNSRDNIERALTGYDPITGEAVDGDRRAGAGVAAATEVGLSAIPGMGAAKAGEQAVLKTAGKELAEKGAGYTAKKEALEAASKAAQGAPEKLAAEQSAFEKALANAPQDYQASLAQAQADLASMPRGIRTPALKQQAALVPDGVKEADFVKQAGETAKQAGADKAGIKAAEDNARQAFADAEQARQALAQAGSDRAAYKAAKADVDQMAANPDAEIQRFRDNAQEAFDKASQPLQKSIDDEAAARLAFDEVARNAEAATKAKAIEDYLAGTGKLGLADRVEMLSQYLGKTAESSFGRRMGLAKAEQGIRPKIDRFVKGTTDERFAEMTGQKAAEKAAKETAEETGKKGVKEKAKDLAASPFRKASKNARRFSGRTAMPVLGALNASAQGSAETGQAPGEYFADLAAGIGRMDPAAIAASLAMFAPGPRKATNNLLRSHGTRGYNMLRANLAGQASKKYANAQDDTADEDEQKAYEALVASPYFRRLMEMEG